MNAQHSSATDDHGTPPTLLRLERTVLGRIDVDPYSSEEWNFNVGASRYIDRAMDGTRTAWVPGAPRPNELGEHALRAEDGFDWTAHVNPPGDKKGALVAGAYRSLAWYHELRWISAAFYVGFSLEHFSRLQRVGAPRSPGSFASLVPDERVPYMVTPNRQSKQPTHASFLTLLSRSRTQIELFCDLATELGDVVVPYKRKATRP